MTHISNLIELKKRVSWGSVFGGVVTVLAVSILLSVLGSSIGLFLIRLLIIPSLGLGQRSA